MLAKATGKKLTEQEKRRRELVRELLKETPERDGQDINNIMKEIIAEIVNGSLEGELEGELGYAKYDGKNKETDNSRNGYGDVDVKIPRDRQGEYEPKLVIKHKRMLDEEIERKIISMYAKGMITGDMESHIRELYGVDISDSTISRIIDKILPLAKMDDAPME